MCEVPLYRASRKYGHAPSPGRCYRATSLIRNNPTLGPYSKTMPRALSRPYGEGLFPMSEVLLQDSPFWPKER